MRRLPAVNEAPRLLAVILEVADLERSAAFYREGFGIPLQPEDHGGDDRWISGAHASYSWHEGAFLHFALYAAKGGEIATGAQIGFATPDLEAAHARLLATGAEVIHPPRPEPWGPTARYHDADGNVVSLTQPPG